MEKMIDFTQNYAIITMNITGECVRKSAKKCRLMNNKLRQGISILINVLENMIEVIKPTNIKNGLLVKFHVYANEHLDKKIDYAKILNEANKTKDNELSEIVKEAWMLDDNPEISNISSDTVGSKQSRLISIEILKQLQSSTISNATNGNEM